MDFGVGDLEFLEAFYGLRVYGRHMPTIRIMGKSTSQPNWVRSGWRMAYLPKF